MKDFNTLKEEYFKTLDFYMPVVERVHGPHHAEIYDVAKVYEVMKDRLDRGDGSLDEDFAKLRQLTDDYQVPDDVCETYEAIYKMLEELDQAYSKH
jgi:iron-sulfur cluster repair protein YtfE (RIC family)